MGWWSCCASFRSLPPSTNSCGSWAATPRGFLYLGRALLILLGEGEDMIVDSEDLGSCFNLWYQPESWKGGHGV